MPAPEFRKKAVYFLIFVGLVTTALVLLPSSETLNLYLADRYGLAVGPGGALVSSTGDRLPMMIETSMRIAANILSILRIVLWMMLIVAIVRFVLLLVTKTLYRNSAQGEVSSLLRTGLSVVVYIVGFFIVFQSQFPDVQLAPLFTGSTIIGIVVGLALQDTLGNLFAGLALQADQSFQVGDVISVGKLGTGVAETVSWRGVKIRTFQNKLLVISNAALGKEVIEVAPRGNLNARLIFFTTVYAAAPTNIAMRVREAVRTSDNVSPKLRPIVRIRNLGTDGIDWEIKYWLEDYSKYNDSDAAIRQRVWYALRRESIEFAFPTRTLHIEHKAPETPAEETVDTIIEHLNKVSIFSPLSDEELTRLAAASSSRVYAPGEAIVQVGQEGNSMFVIISGSVKVQIPENDNEKIVGTLAENDFFGEMSLLTGEPRAANVVAIVETEVLRIDKNGLKPIFDANPVLVESMSEMIEERKAELSAKQGQETKGDISPKTSALRTIRKFFGLR